MILCLFCMQTSLSVVNEFSMMCERKYKAAKAFLKTIKNKTQTVWCDSELKEMMLLVQFDELYSLSRVVFETTDLYFNTPNHKKTTTSFAIKFLYELILPPLSCYFIETSRCDLWLFGCGNLLKTHSKCSYDGTTVHTDKSHYKSNNQTQ